MKASLLWYLTGPLLGYAFIGSLVVVPALTGLCVYVISDILIENEVMPFVLAAPSAVALPLAVARGGVYLFDKVRGVS